MKLISFQLKGRFGHFLRAEGGVSAPTYPVPPRTAILGILGAVLGLEKDQPQVLLEPAHIALRGGLPRVHWHTSKFRQEPIERLPQSIDRKQKARKPTTIDLPKIIAQEWLFNPCYTVWCSVPEPYQETLEGRIRERRWHFQPSLGLSEMTADIVYLGTEKAQSLDAGRYSTRCVFPQESASLDFDTVFEQQLVIHSLRMPRKVTPARVFSHAGYYLERDARPVPVKSHHAFQTESEEVLLYL